MTTSELVGSITKSPTPRSLKTDAVVFNPGFKSPRKGWLNTSIAAERVDAAASLVTTLPDLRRFANALFRGQLLSAKSQAVLTAVEGEMASVAIGTHKTRALQAALTRFGLVLYKEGDGPGGFNTLMAFHPRTGAIFIGFTNEFGSFDEVEMMMTEIMSAMVATLPCRLDGPEPGTPTTPDG